MNNDYPFLKYIQEDKSRYVHAKDAGFIDDDDLFLIGESGGFLLNIISGAKFIHTELFQEMANYYRNNKCYTNYKVDSIPHRQLRKREQFRRKHGFKAPCLMMPDGTIKDVRITGSYYNFLNYTRMEQLDESSVKLGNNNTGEKHYDFPKFIDAQFWTTHVMEFAERNGFHLIIDKTRRGGFSYIMAADSVNTINNEPRKVVIHVAVDKKYLTMTGGLTDFAINDLKFIEDTTPFKRGILSPVKHDFRLGYKLPNGVEANNSWHSSLISVSAYNDPNCAIGKDAKKIKVEEISTMENFEEFMQVTEPTMRTGAYTTGILMGWGTATSGNMQMFERVFYYPAAHNAMPFENVWDDDARHTVCGFFKSYAWGLQGVINGKPAMDEYGNSNLEIGLLIAQKEREEKKVKAKTYAEYLNYLGQYALKPSESFSSAAENIFSSEELTMWANQLKMDNNLHFYVDGMFEEVGNQVIFKSNVRLRKEGKKTYDYINNVPRMNNEDPHGCIRMYFPPEYIENGNRKEIPIGMYSISYDPVGIDKDKDELTMQHSHNSINVWMNPCALNNYNQKLVACYYGRPNTLIEADRICYQLAVYYNCVGTTCVEVNRGETVSNFRKWNALRYLAYEPLVVWDNTMKGKFGSTYGYVVGDGVKKLEALRLLREMLYEKIGEDENGNPVRMFHRIYDYQTIIELIKFSLKGNYDRVSQMLIRAIEYKAMGLNKEKILDVRKDKDEDDFFNRDWF